MSVEMIASAPTPTTGPSIGPENQGAMFGLTQAKRVAVLLAHRGYTVMHVAVSPPNSRITIKAIRACAELGGAVMRREVTPEGAQITMGVRIHGITVEWTTAKRRAL